MKTTTLVGVAALVLPLVLSGCWDSTASEECQELAVQYSDAMNQVGSLQRKADEADAAFDSGSGTFEEYRAAVDATRENNQLMTSIVDEMFAECGSGFANDVVEGEFKEVWTEN